MSKMNLLILTALIPISISILLIAPSHVYAISSNQTSSNETTNSLLKQILNELQQIRQLQHHPVQQQLPNINIPPPQLPPGAVAIPLSQQHGPPLAQIQSDIAKHQQGIQYAQAMINLFNQRLANNTSTAHATQVLKQMTAEGKINCPTPFTNPGHCFLTPKPVGIAPPIPPFANLPPIPPPFLASIVVPAVIAIIQFTIRGGK